MDIESLVQAAYQHALHELAQAGFDVNGACLEASVLMHKYLRRHGIRAELIRREHPDGGHWTIRTPAGEYDPTISAWHDAPRDATGLYRVSKSSPQHKWPETVVDEERAYAVWYGENEE